MSLNKPNVVLPLAVSYNERGIDGFAATVTNSLDQRKINVQYEPVKNAVTGKTTLYVVPRPGVVLESGTFGSADQTAYLVSREPGGVSFSPTEMWVISLKGANARASSNATTTVIAAGTSRPLYVDLTNINGTETLVAQFSPSVGTDVTYYSSDIATFTQISDADFTALDVQGKMEHLDGYAHVLASNNRIHSSDLNSLANWTATSFVTKQIQQDLPRGLARFKNQILAFGSRTVEGFYNAGTATGSPLQKIPQSFANVGLTEISGSGVTHYYAPLREMLYFVGQFGGGEKSKIVIAYNGSNYERVSTNAVERIIGAGGGVQTYSVSSILYGGQEAIAISLTAPGTTPQRALLFFPAWNDWFEWTSDVFQPVNQGKFFLAAGTSSADSLYSIRDTNSWIDHSTDYTREIVFNVPTDGNQLRRMAWAGVVADSQSSGASSSAGTYLQMAVAKNGDFSFGAARQIDLRGRKKQIYRWGAFRDCAVKITHSGNAQFRIQNFIAKTL